MPRKPNEPQNGFNPTTRRRPRHGPELDAPPRATLLADGALLRLPTGPAKGSAIPIRRIKAVVAYCAEMLDMRASDNLGSMSTHQETVCACVQMSKAVSIRVEVARGTEASYFPIKCAYLKRSNGRRRVWNVVLSPRNPWHASICPSLRPTKP